ncbi:ABC transporter permease [Bosea sp. CS1GBMeth4]|uniref:ABC transporter permease n=1 Tax=Bosea sp. CS1GBMeth4 TaxID=1892849 RepID=UPI001646541E|nr:ABC transporter permease [Bosea sp. CS1GBMeth4]
MTTVDLPSVTAPAARPRTCAMSPVVKLSAGFLLVIVLVALLADWLAPLPYTAQNLAARLKPPLTEAGGTMHWLGTDQLGRDILSRMVFAIRSSILIAVMGTLIGAVVGTALGFAAARLRGVVDQAIMMAVDAQAAIPALFLALTMLAFFGNNIVLFIILVSVDGWDRYTRLARGLVVSEQESDYINAVEALGAGAPRVILRHLLPNIAAALVVQATLNFPGTILLETSLSFLGLGVQPPGTSLGLMLGEGRRYLLNAWWIAVFPGLAIFLTTLSMSLFGDWLRDRFDPTSERH